MSEALQPAWQDLYLIDKVLGGLSYRIDMDGKFKNVHVKVFETGRVLVGKESNHGPGR